MPTYSLIQQHWGGCLAAAFGLDGLRQVAGMQGLPYEGVQALRLSIATELAKLL
ncbi:MAG: hypothetical protein NTX45_13285 [Proteobacteria bacterium]|nr:hypothetical protein [Pseudomonadota bacterium]